ncbi:MAG: RNA polymerase subunit sigma-70 [Rhizobiales bacterium 65-79]|jgi:RNA polymerase sigma-70 factor (ECF subfamily)|nr:RNA polymerase subunit sigma-70 [Hyphomicrobiales bacterium]OJU05731.1 MAG: RNA polymerase subunit sigma-70 [Rhizobiales bacterium 65-79]
MRGTEDEARAAAEAAARRSYGKLVAFLSARTRDVAAAEDALADAFASALARWPVAGIPDNPEAWLMAAARRKAIDGVRRQRTRVNADPHLKLMAEEASEVIEEGGIPDERLRLMFACAHPAIDPAIRAPLILQTILGFDAARIASAFLVSPSTMGQRLVRAKARIRETGIPFRIPDRPELPERLDAVLAAIYAAFAEGWADPAGTETRRRELAGEAIWLGRLVASLMPNEPEALGLVSLMLFAEARRAARRDTNGGYVPLAEQDVTKWDQTLITEAEGLLLRASAMGRPGRYQIEAAIQSAHVVRRSTGQADWRAIVDLYGVLAAMVPSPVVAVNRAVAVAQAGHAGDALAALDELADDPRLADYQPYWAARAELLARAGKQAEAATAYDRAIGLEPDPSVRAFLQERRMAMKPQTSS